MNLPHQDGKLLDTRTQKFAFRRAIVVQDELEGQEGRSFLFEINNIRVFCGGMSSLHMPMEVRYSRLLLRFELDPCRLLPDQVTHIFSRLFFLS